MHEGDNFFKNIILFEIKPVLTLRKNLIANLSIVKIFENKMKFHGDAATDLDNKEIHKVSTYHTCLEEISLNSALNKNGNYYPQVFLNEFKYI